MEPLSFIEAEAYLYLAVFCRIGSALMILPSFGDMMVPQRVRLMLAFAISVLLTPVVGGDYPVISEHMSIFVGVIFGEIAYGLALGLLIRMFLMALNVAGTVIATQTGLAFAQNFDPSLGIQGAILSSFFSMLALTLILQTDLHHVMIASIRESYWIFAPGTVPDWASFADLATRTFARSFRFGLQMAAPFIVFSLVFYAAAGAIARLLPQIQIFFLVIPLNILAGFGLFMLLIGSLMTFYMEAYEETLRFDWF